MGFNNRRYEPTPHLSRCWFWEKNLPDQLSGPTSDVTSAMIDTEDNEWYDKQCVLFYLNINDKTEYLSNQVFVLIGSEWHEKWQVHGNVNDMSNQMSLLFWQRIVRQRLVKIDHRKLWFSQFWIFDPRESASTERVLKNGNFGIY